MHFVQTSHQIPETQIRRVCNNILFISLRNQDPSVSIVTRLQAGLPGLQQQ